MEAITLGASVIAVLQIIDRLIGICKFYIETAGEAAADLRTILLEISMLKTIFENLEFLRTCNKDLIILMATLTGKDGPIQGCHRSIRELEKLFPPENVNQSGQSSFKKQKLQQTWQALAWPLKKRKATKLLDEILRYKTSIMLALTTVQSHDITTIKTNTEGMYDMLTDNQLDQVWNWIRGTDPSPLHNKAQKQYEAGTGNWIMRLPEWASWLAASIRCLWVYGIPGAGKTVLMSYLIEQVKKYSEEQEEKTIAYSYYYAYFGHKQDEAEPFLRWIIEQVCRKKRRLPTKVYQLYQAGGAPSLTSLLSCLEDVIQDLEVLYIILDAVDESSPREDLLKVIRDLATDARFEKVQLLVSSRNYLDIEKTMKIIATPISMSNEFVDNDIRHLVRAKIKSNVNLSSWPSELHMEVENALTEGAEGMFRWAVCQLQVLQRVKNDPEVIQKTLNTLPKTLDETYERILLEISEEDALIVQATLHWIYYHSMLLEGSGISCAILLQGIEKFIARSDGDQDERIDKERIQELCGCLIHMTVKPSRGGVFVKETPLQHCEVLAVSFAHYTVLEYLISARCPKGPVGHFALHTEHTMLSMMEIVFCEALKADNCMIDIITGRTGPLFELWEDFISPDENFRCYCIITSVLAVQKWAHEISQKQLLSSLVFDLLDPSGAHYSDLCEGARHTDLNSHYSREIHEGAMFWRLEYDLNQFDKDACHLLNLALLSQWSEGVSELLRKLIERKGSRSVLRSRLKFDWECEILSEECKNYHFNGTLLDIFSQLAYDHHAAFKIFLEYSEGFFDPSIVLMLYVGFHQHDIWSSCKDYCPVARLLQLGADPSTKKYGLTPLQIAVGAIRDFESIRLLLEAGANPNDIGNCDEEDLEESTVMSLFKPLKGASPLYLCRNSDGLFLPVFNQDFRHQHLTEIDTIETILLEHRAKDFKIIPND